ncbi:MAG: hypothetical protein Q8R37_05210 [Nanoarchaeota archaeon]|nr:hypothetical protein [Nanoarchaeota archaeon]
MIKAHGIKGIMLALATLFVIIVILILAFQFIILILPLIVIFIILSYLFKIFNKLKTEKPKDYIDVRFKVK